MYEPGEKEEVGLKRGNEIFLYNTHGAGDR
jgi:hypothetical protein